jgi:hypothetical protein
MDVAGSLFTSDHRRIKIEGRPPLSADERGTGSVRFLSARNAFLLRVQMRKNKHKHTSTNKQTQTKQPKTNTVL